MYINEISIKNFRTFQDEKISFIHPHQNFDKLEMPTPQIKNVNLLLGNNGAGKTALLKAIGLASLGPAAPSSGIYPYRLIRRTPKTKNLRTKKNNNALISASFTPHPQDRIPISIKTIESELKIVQKGDLEVIEWSHKDSKLWHPVFSDKSDAFFMVGYGATRRVESESKIDPASRSSANFIRAQRIKGLFEESYSLFPLDLWLPKYKSENPGRYKQVVNLVNKLMIEDGYHFDGEIEDGKFLFEKGGLKVPFPALSDGYRAFLGWLGDLLYHVCQTCPSGKKLVENAGIVMIDEIDLHLHPKWQMTILPTLAAQLPNIQFIVTSHSPLVVGTLEWMNIILMSPEPKKMTTHLERLKKAVHGLDADQILLTDFFGLDSTRVESKKRNLKELSLSASRGNVKAAKELLEQMSKGMETVE